MRLIQHSRAEATPKEHFAVLDGLRGIAAIAVIIFHFMEFIRPDYNDNFIAHGYLAVDLFFCLSGFVIAFSYDSRISQRGVMWFIGRRVIRLHPLVILGAFLGLLAFIFDPFSSLYAKYGTEAALLMAASAATLIPWPDVPERYNNLFYMNPPTWSLFWEYVASLAYALFLVRLSNRVLAGLAVMGAAGLIYTAAHFGNLAVGWGGENALAGSARVFYSFLAGILLFRSGWVVNNPLGPVSVGGMLLAAFLIPWSDSANATVDPIVVILFFPLLVAIGAGAEATGSARSACDFLGDISYPLYMMHYPFLWLFLGYLETEKPSPLLLSALVPVLVVALIILSYGILVAFDLPVRRYVLEKWRR